MNGVPSGRNSGINRRVDGEKRVAQYVYRERIFIPLHRQNRLGTRCSARWGKCGHELLVRARGGGLAAGTVERDRLPRLAERVTPEPGATRVVSARSVDCFHGKQFAASNLYVIVTHCESESDADLPRKSLLSWWPPSCNQKPLGILTLLAYPHRVFQRP